MITSTTTPQPSFFNNKTSILLFVILPLGIILFVCPTLGYIISKVRRSLRQHKRGHQIAPEPMPAPIVNTVMVDGVPQHSLIPW